MALTVRFNEIGGPEVLRLDDLEPREPGPGEVRVRVSAIGLNRAEVAFRGGSYIERPNRFPAVLGYEAAGVIEEVGDGVDGFSRGQPVSVVPAFSMNDYGTYGERVVVPARAVIGRPDDVDPIAGAAAWMQYLTVYGALVDIGDLGTGDTVVVTAAASSVGLAAIELADRIGARPIAVLRDTTHERRVREAGAAAVVVAEGEELTRGILAHSDGADLVFDAVAGPAVRDLARATVTGGSIIVHGTLSGRPTPFPGTDTMRALTMRSYTLFEITRDERRLRRAAEFITPRLRSGELTPIVDRMFDLTEIVRAHRYLESGSRLGKVVVTVSGGPLEGRS